MKEKINIEKLFQDSLNQLDVNAPQEAWTNIEKQLNKKEEQTHFAAILVEIWRYCSGISGWLLFREK